MSEELQNISFPQMEEKILDFWNKNQIFQKSLDPKKKPYSFYDGPPFATGLPHYGHLLASTLKDIVPRYWTMKGYHVPRKWGWDCHGLPIEQEIDKKFQFKSTEEIEKFGIAKYNEECRSIVLRFTAEWEKSIGRLGRWADFKNDYKTMDMKFMESVWWVFKELWDKGLIYRGYKVMAFSTALGTPLSNFEAGSNYMDVQDPAITITFPLLDDASTSFLAWTTTPWTLPSNLALAVGEEIEYVKIETEDAKKFILAAALMPSLFDASKVKILETKVGKDLVGLRYQPLFKYFASAPQAAKYFQVVLSGHVTTESGTGIVHIAPAFGEDDFNVGKKLGIDPICPVDHHGRFTAEVSDLSGQYVKDADKVIIKNLKDAGRLFKQDTLQHAYPFCPRTDTPLIYRALSSWFVKVEAVKDRILKNNHTQTHWVPEHLRDGRFGKWLENARDWAISRNRYWGNPLPIWESFELPENKREYICFGNVADLEKATGKKFKDLHREHLDDVVFEKDGKKFRRIPEVLDCWFESGAMPYAQYHYPFENQQEFKDQFPADFIAEGLDQTRGWFYTLSVLGTILFDRSPFRNVVVNGLILAEDGKKMSKRLKNYPDPMEVMNKHGADALRLYLIDSPVIRGEELRFSEKGVQEIVRKVLLKLWNSYSFYESYSKIDNFQPDLSGKAPTTTNILDKWIISRMQSLLLRVETEMKDYRLYNVVPELLVFIEELTNTYIRLNRPRFWSEGADPDKLQAFGTLHFVLLEFAKTLAPFAPYISEQLYSKLTKSKQMESVHLDVFPTAAANLVDHKLELGVSLLEEAILLARSVREKEKIKVKLPLKEMILVHRKPEALEALLPLESYLKSELNVRKLSYRSDEKSFVDISIKANGATLGPKVGKRMKELSDAIAKLSLEDLQKLEAQGSLSVAGVDLSTEDVKVFRTPVKGSYPTQASSKLAVALDTKIERDQELEGTARELVNRIQIFRKESGLQLDDRISVEIAAEGEIAEAVKAFGAYIQEQTLATNLKISSDLKLPKTQDAEIDGLKFRMALQKVERIQKIS